MGGHECPSDPEEFSYASFEAFQINPSSVSARITEGIAFMRSKQFRRFSGSSTLLLAAAIRTQER